MNWFERLTGFTERIYEETRFLLTVEDGHLLVNGRRFAIGRFELVPLAALRARVQAQAPALFNGRLRVRNVSGDVGAMHRDPALAGALFQVASQLNVLEMPGPGVTPEDGVTGYEHDRTQGPACAIAAGAATLYRNYLVPVDGQDGQTAARQIDASGPLRDCLARALSLPPSGLWETRNGYALATATGLAAINTHLAGLDEPQRDELRAQLAIGLQWDVEVTTGDWPGPRVSQAFCSALPVNYSPHPPQAWDPFAQLVLEAGYEATLWAAVLNAHRGASPIVLLTRVGGGVFGNHDSWINAAMDRALTLAQRCDLDVRLVSHGAPGAAMLDLERRAKARDGRPS